MNRFNSFSDDYYVNMNLATEMDLQCSRESILHYFEQIQKRYPSMHNFYQRDKSDYVLEEDKDRGNYRWCSIEPRRIGSGQVNPESLDSIIEQHRTVLEIAPCSLTISPLDCEALDFLMGFDFSYRGNHNELIAEALGANPAFEPLVAIPGASIVSIEPSITVAIDEECRTQCRIAVEPRTTAYQIRTGEYAEDQLSVYVTTRQYGGLGKQKDFASSMLALSKVCFEIIDNYVAEQILQPLASTIALK